MERAILASDRSLDLQASPAHTVVQPPTPRQLPAAVPDFTGREDILNQIACHWLRPGMPPPGICGW